MWLCECLWINKSIHVYVCVHIFVLVYVCVRMRLRVRYWVLVHLFLRKDEQYRVEGPTALIKLRNIIQAATDASSEGVLNYLHDTIYTKKTLCSTVFNHFWSSITAYLMTVCSLIEAAAWMISSQLRGPEGYWLDTVCPYVIVAAIAQLWHRLSMLQTWSTTSRSASHTRCRLPRRAAEYITRSRRLTEFIIVLISSKIRGITKKTNYYYWSLSITVM